MVGPSLTRWGCLGTNGNWRETTPFPAGRDGARPLHGNRKFQQPPGPAAHSGASAARSRGVGRNRSRDHPQSVQQRRTIPQSPCGRQLPLHKGAFGDGDTDCRVASLLAMTVLILCHSEKAQRADVGIRLFYDGRGFGPSYLEHGLRRPNSVPKFGASVKSSAPTEGLPESQQRADVGIDPYGTKRELPRPPGQRSERGKSRWSNSAFAR